MRFHCNDNYTVAWFNAVITVWNNNLIFPCNTGNQIIRPELQILKRNSRIPGRGFYDEFKSLNLVIYKLIHCLDIGASLRILSCPHIA